MDPSKADIFCVTSSCERYNSLARAVFLHWLGEIRDIKPENQSYCASGLTLLTAAIWKGRSMH